MSGTNRALLGAAIATALWPHAAAAQETIIELPGIVIEGGSLDLTPVPVERQSSAVTVVTREEIEARQARLIEDVLRTVPGLAVNRTGGVGGLTDVRVRGSESNHVLVLIDGVEVNDTTNGSFDFSQLVIEDIEQIEVVRGPQSGLWGSNALGGLINIVTARGKGPARLTASLEGGSFDTRGFSLGLSGGNESIWGSVSGIGRETEGFNVASFGEETDGARITSLQMRGGVQIAPWLTAEAFLRSIDKRVDLDGFGAAPGAVPGDLAVALDQTDTKEDRNTLVAGGVVTVDPFDGFWQTRLYANSSNTEQGNADLVFGKSASRSNRQKVGATTKLTFDQPSLQGTRHTLTGLVEQEDERFSQSSDPADPQRSKQSFAGEYRGEFFDQLFLSAAGRHDNSDAFGAFDTYRLGAAWLYRPTGTRFHASQGTGVVFPTMFEQFGVIPGFFTPNPDLRPETSTGWDAGVEQQLLEGRLIVDVTYFQQDLIDEISAPFFGPPVNLAGESTREGVEVTATLRPFTTLDIVASYTRLDAREPSGLTEVRRPEHAGSLNAIWRFADGRGRLSAGVVYNGEMQDFAFDAFTFAQQRVLLDAYTVVNVAASYDLTDELQLFGRVENAFDTDYTEVFGFETAGVAAYAGVRMKLEERATAVTGE